MTDVVKKPWYRERMVWMLIAIPFSAVVMGVIMITLAVVTWDGLVVDDYYKQGKEINRVLVRDQYAMNLGISAELVWSVSDQRVAVSLSSTSARPDSKEIDLHFLHPTMSGLDYSVKLAQGPDGRYFGLVPALAEGSWIIQIGTDIWRLNARATLDSDPVIVHFKPEPVG